MSTVTPPRREPAGEPPPPRRQGGPSRRELELRRRRRRRLVPLAVLAAAAFAVGVTRGAGQESAGTRVASQFVRAWEGGDYAAMHRLLTPAAQRRYPEPSFRESYRQAAMDATAISLQAHDPGDVHASDGRSVVPVRVQARTRLFKRQGGTVDLPLSGEGENAHVAWAPHLVWPGLRPGQELRRRSIVPQRGPILAANGKPLAAGQPGQRGSDVPGAAAAAGEVGVPQDPALARRAEARGFPPGAAVGLSGIERSFDRVLAGRPGGQLEVVREGGGDTANALRTLATARPVKGRAVRTTISPAVQASAVAALAGRFGGVVALDPRTGNVLALAGIATDLQPPGSTFKIVTTSAALQAGLVKPTSQFPVQSATFVDGKEITNASRESCGGTLAQSFAESCNSVFAPLGVKVGADRLVGMAERYGWNKPPLGFESRAQVSTIPPADELGGDLSVAVSAIGQGEVQASPLQMAIVSATVADRGLRRPVHIVSGRLRSRARPVRATSAAVAAKVRALMVGVVKNGTGAAAAIPGVKVAGKTGTAELGRNAEENEKLNTDAWFTAFAPARAPKIVAAALLVKAGAGGDVAAPLVRQVLLAGLNR